MTPLENVVMAMEVCGSYQGDKKVEAMKLLKNNIEKEVDLMKRKKRIIFLILNIMALMMIVVTFSACTTKNEDISSESLADGLEGEGYIASGSEEEVYVDECDEEVIEQEGRGGELAPMTFTEGAFAGQYNPADIRGSYTLADISQYFEIPIEILAEAFNMPLEDAPLVQNKYYKYLFEGLEGSGKSIGNGSMIVFVSMYKGLPFDIHEPEYLLEPAASILKNIGMLSEQELDYLNKYVVTVQEAEQIPLAELVLPEDNDDEYRIYGRTTFGDLINMGISEEQISKIIDAPMPSVDIRIKDYCVENDLPFSDYVRLEIYDILYRL